MRLVQNESHIQFGSIASPACGFSLVLGPTSAMTNQQTKQSVTNRRRRKHHQPRILNKASKNQQHQQHQTRSIVTFLSPNLFSSIMHSALGFRLQLFLVSSNRHRCECPLIYRQPGIIAKRPKTNIF